MATYVCARPEDKSYVVDHLSELVVKAVDEAGGAGMLMGPSATRAEQAEFRERILADPRKYIAQHRVELSSCPTWDSRELRLVPRPAWTCDPISSPAEEDRGCCRRSYARRVA